MWMDNNNNALKIGTFSVMRERADGRIEPEQRYLPGYLQSTLFAWWRQQSYLKIGLLKNLLSIKGLRLWQLMKRMHYTNLTYRRSAPIQCIQLDWLSSASRQHRIEHRTCFRTLWRQIIGDSTHVFSAHNWRCVHLDAASIASKNKIFQVDQKTLTRRPQHKSNRRTIETNWPFSNVSRNQHSQRPRRMCVYKKQ